MVAVRKADTAKREEQERNLKAVRKADIVERQERNLKAARLVQKAQRGEPQRR